MKYLIVIEKTQTGFSAYSPDVDGCIAAGNTMEEVERIMKEALEFHIGGLKKEGYDVPISNSYTTYLEI
ncbi:MAG: type II toxin-antitoxin system HicB family antitoxin [Candidatus Magnetoovum sp. WYHC-5]|nr:type II toxin-antitoxin system HicB family antitoxin [Candidatus Magnetoovum sp. WYHC-5]